MQPGQWAMMNKFDDAMLAGAPAMIDRIQPVMDGRNVEQKNALTLLQLGLEHFHPYIAGLLWVTGLEAIFDSGGRAEFKKKLCDCLGPQTPAFPNWHSKPDAPPYTVEEIAIPLFVLRNKRIARISSAASPSDRGSAQSSRVDLPFIQHPELYAKLVITATIPAGLRRRQHSGKVVICLYRYCGACRPSAFSTSTSGVVTPLVLVTTPKLV